MLHYRTLARLNSTQHFTYKINVDVFSQSRCVLSHFSLTLCNPMEYSPPGSSVHGIFQARMLEWIAISYSKGSSRPRDQAWSLVSPALAGRFFTAVLPRKPKQSKIFGANRFLATVTKVCILFTFWGVANKKRTGMHFI